MNKNTYDTKPPNPEPVLYCVQCRSLERHLIACERRCGDEAESKGKLPPLPVFEQVFSCLTCGQHRRYGFTTTRVWKDATIGMMQSIQKARAEQGGEGWASSAVC